MVISVGNACKYVHMQLYIFMFNESEEEINVKLIYELKQKDEVG